MNSIVISQAAKLGGMFGIEGNGSELIAVLKATAFKGQVSDAQMSALMIVASQYKLNPFTKEIFAFPDKNNGIVPVVGVDGWSRIINENPQFDGMDFDITDEAATCTIYRKDRNHPIKVTEYLSECKRGTQPWQSHPKRMLRHKAMIQCARLAFGYVGIYDDDEAQRIVEAKREIDITPPAKPEEKSLPIYAQADFDKNLPAWRKLIESGKQTAQSIIAKVETKALLTEEQKAVLLSIKKLEVVGRAAPEQIEKIRTWAADMAVQEADVCAVAGAESIDTMTPEQAEKAIAFLNGDQ